MSSLARFKAAQDQQRAGFDAALREIESGRKQGHWIWYVFPQLAGLGASPAASEYGIQGNGEAMAFLRDAELRARLLTISRAVAVQLAGGRTLPSLMGSHVDALKVVSSLTLFRAAARRLHAEDGDDVYEQVADVADDVLAAAASQGYPACAFTLDRIE